MQSRRIGYRIDSIWVFKKKKTRKLLKWEMKEISSYYLKRAGMQLKAVGEPCVLFQGQFIAGRRRCRPLCAMWNGRMRTQTAATRHLHGQTLVGSWRGSSTHNTPASIGRKRTDGPLKTRTALRVLHGGARNLSNYLYPEKTKGRYIWIWNVGFSPFTDCLITRNIGILGESVVRILARRVLGLFL